MLICRLFIAEQVVLRLMSFQLRVQQPLKQLLNFCRLLAVSSAVAAAAVCLMNDAVAYTQLLLGQDAAVVAAAALQLAWKLLQQQQQQQEGVDAGPNSHSWAVSAGAAIEGRRSREETSTQQGRDWSQEQRSSSRNTSHRQHHLAADSDGRASLGGDDDAHRSGARRSSHSFGRSAAPAAAMDAVLSDGSWLAVVGLQESEVAEVQQVLQQLLNLQQQQQQQQQP
jgi:hypothetical protein